jgi:3-hydroxyisobutyrate dehydrogenase
MTRVGFIGLGLIGRPMCLNILKAGHEVTVWNRTPSRMDELVAAGAARSSSPRAAAERSEITITMVSDSPDVEEVIVGDGGVIEGAAPDSVVVDMSTISPSVTVSIAGTLRSRGIHMMDAPVSGGVTGAEEGKLSIMVGGDRSVFDRVMPIYQAMGSRITYCGDSGMGQITKLSNQIIGLGNLAAMCEALVFATKAGGDPEALMEAWSGGAAGSWMVQNLGPRILDGDFAPGFMVKLALKDLRLVLESAARLDVPLFTTALVSQIFRSAQQADLGDEGIQAYVKVLEGLAGVEARATQTGA